MEITIWRNKWTRISIKTFYFVNHQLYLVVPGLDRSRQSHSRVVCCTLQDIRRHCRTAGGGGASAASLLPSLPGSWSCDRKRGACQAAVAVTSCSQAAASCCPGLGVGETSQNVVTAYVMLPWHPSFPDHQPPPTIATRSLSGHPVVAQSDTCQSLLSSDTFGNVKNYQAMKNYI